MTAKERAEQLYPTRNPLTDDEIYKLMQDGLFKSIEEIKFVQSRIKFNSAINKEMQEAYLRGREEANDYE